MNYRWSAEEERKLRRMKELLQGDLAGVPQYPDVTGDRRLLRFLRARTLHVDKAVDLFRRFLAFRREHEVDAIHERICEYALILRYAVVIEYSEGESQYPPSLPSWGTSTLADPSDSEYYQRS